MNARRLLERQLQKTMSDELVAFKQRITNAVEEIKLDANERIVMCNNELNKHKEELRQKDARIQLLEENNNKLKTELRLKEELAKRMLEPIKVECKVEPQNFKREPFDNDVIVLSDDDGNDDDVQIVENAVTDPVDNTRSRTPDFFGGPSRYLDMPLID